MSTEYGDRTVAVENEILRVEVGSGAHGTGLPGVEDVDLMGVFIEPQEYVMGLKQMDQYIYRDADEGQKSWAGSLDLTLYSLRKYVRLTAAGNPSMLLALFAPPPPPAFRPPVWKTWHGEVLREQAPLFLSKEAGRRFLGYSESQRQKLLGLKGGLPPRPELVEKYGYDTKFAMHMVRLGYQGREFLEYGKITLPIPGGTGEALRKIRRGEWRLEDVLDEASYNEEQLRWLIDRSYIPERANYDALNRLLVGMHEDWWGR